MTDETRRDEYGRLGSNLGFLAARFSYVAAKAANVALEPFGLRTRSYSLLELASTGAGRSQRELGRDLELDPSHIVRLVDELVERGLVERVRDSRDARRAIIHSTAEGTALAAEAGAALASLYDELLNPLPADDRADVVRLLQRLAFEVGSAVPRA